MSRSVLVRFPFGFAGTARFSLTIILGIASGVAVLVAVVVAVYVVHSRRQAATTPVARNDTEYDNAAFSTRVSDVRSRQTQRHSADEDYQDLRDTDESTEVDKAD